MNEWYYMQGGHQVGPLTEEALKQLIRAGAIRRETMVWKSSLPSWMPAEQTMEFIEDFMAIPISPPAQIPQSWPVAPVSPKSRVAAGVLNLFFPGVGRLYLGYITIGILQLALGILSCGILHIWSFIDAILILCGQPSTDADGRPLTT